MQIFIIFTYNLLFVSWFVDKISAVPVLPGNTELGVCAGFNPVSE